MDQADKDSIELEVRRLLAAEQTELRKQWSEEATGFRDFLQRQFRYITLGVSTFAFVGVGLFVWFFSDSVSRTQQQLEATVDAKIIDYRIVESFKTRVAEIVELAASSEETNALIAARVEQESQGVVRSLAEEVIREQVRKALADVEQLDVGALLQRAAIPAGAVLGFDAAGCPDGWSAFVAGEGRFLMGSGNGLAYRGTGGDAFAEITPQLQPKRTVVEVPDLRTLTSSPLFGKVKMRRVRVIGEVRATPLEVPTLPPFIALSLCRKD
ncbi:MAG: hypothetical protein AB8B85_06560 [Paracoccaceae bacterium]